MVKVESMSWFACGAVKNKHQQGSVWASALFLCADGILHSLRQNSTLCSRMVKSSNFPHRDLPNSNVPRMLVNFMHLLGLRPFLRTASTSNGQMKNNCCITSRTISSNFRTKKHLAQSMHGSTVKESRDVPVPTLLERLAES